MKKLVLVIVVVAIAVIGYYSWPTGSNAVVREEVVQTSTPVDQPVAVQPTTLHFSGLHVSPTVQ